MVVVLDVAGRLAEGRGAVEDIQTYVWACRVRGYQHPDLTLHGNQIREWYGLQDGLDLRALDADAMMLRAATHTAGDALTQARSAAAALSGVWTGAGGSAAAEFLDRHCACAVDVADGLQAAAQACAVLRDELWRAVDRQVAAVLAVDAGAARSLWLPAAQSVLGGGQVDDDTVAVVDDQLKPFVDNVIRGEWLPAMRAAAAEVDAAYRAAIDVLRGYGPVRFEVPGDLGPRYDAPATAPVAAQTPAHVAAPAPASAPVPVPSTPAAVAPATPPAPAPAPAPPTSLPGLDAGAAPLSGLADSLGGLLGSPADLAGPGPGGGPPDLPELDPPELTEQEDEPVGPGEEDPEEEPEDPEEEPQTQAEPEEEPADPEEPEDDPADPVPAEDPAGEEPPAEPVPEPPAPSTGTPCEIAAEELPQAGQ